MTIRTDPAGIPYQPDFEDRDRKLKIYDFMRLGHTFEQALAWVVGTNSEQAAKISAWKTEITGWVTSRTIGAA